MRSGFALAALGAAFLLNSPATAAMAQDAAPAVAGECELHVWPSSGLRSVYYGWLHGGIVDGAINGRKGYPPVPRDPVPTALQIELLSTLDLPRLLKLPGYRTIVHPEPLPSRAIRAATGRLTESTSTCYAELVGDDVFFQQDAFSGRFLKSLIRFRAFETGAQPVRTFGTWTETKLVAFPPKEPAGNAAALDELQSAYLSNIKNFAGFLHKPAKKKKK